MTYVLLSLACSDLGNKGYERDTGVPYFPTGESDTDTDTDSDTDTDTDTDTDSDTDADTDTTKFDCKGGLPPFPPYDSREIEDSNTAEDMDIDNDGYIIGSDRLNLYRSNVDGDNDMIMPNVGNPQMVVVMPSDDILVYEETCSLERLDSSGDREQVATNLYLPYGDASPDGKYVYATNPDFWCGTDGKNTIVRIDPFENEVEEILDWDEDYPWGISFNEDYTALYVSVVQGFDAYMNGPSRIYKLNLDKDGYIDGDPELFVEFDGDSYWTEGLAVDVCGNVYASLGTKIVRIMKDTKEVDTIWEADSGSSWGRAISGLAFGRKGEGGTDPLKLYASNPYAKWAVEIDAGVYGKFGW